LCRWAPPLVGLVAPVRKWYCDDPVLPAICSAVEIWALVLSYQPRDPRFASSKFSWNRRVPPPDAAVTVIADVPLFPELVAVIVAEPAATPETTPPEFTVAAAALLVDQVTVWPVITLPFWSFTVACRVVVVPATIEADGGATVTVVTTGVTAVTVIAEVPDLPELVAVIVAEPAAMPATMPLEFTVAVAALLVDQVMVCPVIVLPFWSFTVACKVVVVPATIEAEGGATVTVVTTGATAVTVIADVPDLPPHVAVIVAEPAATPETTPLEFTVAAAALLVDQVTVCPVIALPFW
jgi:hypothetical protein